MNLSVTTATITLTSSIVQPNDVVLCRATATDAQGASTNATDSVIVGNSDPLMTKVEITPDSGVSTSDLLSCSGTALDPDGGTPHTISYEWSVGGTVVGSSDTLQLTSSGFAPGDVVVCTATATDSDGGSDSLTDSITIQNTKPTIRNVAISPATGVTTSTGLTCSGVVSDADGGTPTTTYAWTRIRGTTTTTLASTTSTLTLTNAIVQPTDKVVCTLTATDSDGGSSSGTASVLVDNTNPTVDSVQVTPNSGVKADSALSCSATASDDDGGTPTLSYTWLEGSTADWFGYHHHAGPNSHRCRGHDHM